MAYQNVGTPRFYINLPEFVGIKDESIILNNSPSYYNYKKTHFYTLPVNPTPLYGVANIWKGAEFANNPDGGPFTWGLSSNCFVAILGHDMLLYNTSFWISRYISYEGWYTFDPHGFALTNVVNTEFDAAATEGTEHNTNKYYAPYNGFSIATFVGSGTGLAWLCSNYDVPIGSIVLGEYFDMPQSPNLSLSLSYEYDGLKTITTKGGSDLSYSKYTKPKWGNLGAWELDVGSPITEMQELRKSGRRSWDLKFSFMDDGNLWGSNQSLFKGNVAGDFGLNPADFDTGDVADNGDFQYNLLTDDNFFSQVWHKTNGGVLPFIFQPDNTNNKPDQFAICKFKNNSLKATQSAFNVYDISLSIEEVW